MKKNLIAVIILLALTPLFWRGVGGEALAQVANGTGAGNCLNYDGVDDYVNFAAIPNINGNSQLTLQFWINYQFSLNSQTVFTQWQKSYVPAGMSAGFLCLVGGGIVGVGLISGEGIGSISNLNTGWNHVSVVFDGAQPINSDKINIYINGINSALNFTFQPTPLPSVIGPQNAITHIGARRNNSNELMDLSISQIDEVSIWNRALTQTEIRDNMCKKLNGNESGLVGYWRFDESSGSTVNDASGNGNNGTLY